MFCRPRESIGRDPREKLKRVLRGYGVDGRLLLAVESLCSFPARKFVFVSVELKHNHSRLVLDPDQGVQCHRSYS